MQTQKINDNVTGILRENVKMMKLFCITLLILLLLGIFLFSLLTFSIPKGSYQGPVSDHFNGNVFFNHKPSSPKSLFDLWRWWFSRERKPWPTQIANVPHEPITPVTQPNTVKITFVNHATVLIQTPSANLLTDPIWSERASPFSWWGPRRVRTPGIGFAELPHIDVIVISHNHYDHLDISTLLKLDKKFHPFFLVPLGNKILLNNAGIKNVIELDWWQSYEIKKARITFLPSQHWSARWLNDRNKTLWGSYGIEVANKKIYFAGDSGYENHFKTIREKWHIPDFALLPIGSYLPRWFMHDNHMNPEEAIQAHLDLQSAQSMAIHFGTFQLSDEAIDQPVKDLMASLTTYGISANQFRVLKEGETITLQ